jgi:glycosyltransferase involved in cell wall biosynthesis
MGSPLCSVVMPVYNGRRFLEAALQSIFGQTEPNFELIAIDDGSTDDTPAILARYSTDPRLKIMSQTHLGLAAGRNAGLKAATTNLIMNLDSDDIMASNRIERQLTFMRENPAIAGAGSFYTIINEQGDDRGTVEAPWTTIDKVNLYLDHGGNPIYPNPTMIFRKSAALSVGGYRQEYDGVEDVDLFLRMLLARQYLLIQPEYLTFFRYHSSSSTATNGRRNFELCEILFFNFRRQRAGLPPISMHDYKENIAHLSLLSKLSRKSRYLSRRFLAGHGAALVRNQKMLAKLLLAGAAVCDPTATINKMQRNIKYRQTRS